MTTNTLENLCDALYLLITILDLDVDDIVGPWQGTVLSMEETTELTSYYNSTRQ